MALQSALNELRNKSSGASRGHSYLTGEGKQKLPPASASVFSLEDSDLFDFEDDELFSPPTSSADSALVHTSAASPQTTTTSTRMHATTSASTSDTARGSSVESRVQEGGADGRRWGQLGGLVPAIGSWCGDGNSSYHQKQALPMERASQSMDWLSRQKDAVPVRSSAVQGKGQRPSADSGQRSTTVPDGGQRSSTGPSSGGQRSSIGDKLSAVEKLSRFKFVKSSSSRKRVLDDNQVTTPISSKRTPPHVHGDKGIATPICGEAASPASEDKHRKEVPRDNVDSISGNVRPADSDAWWSDGGMETSTGIGANGMETGGMGTNGMETSEVLTTSDSSSNREVPPSIATPLNNETARSITTPINRQRGPGFATPIKSQSAAAINRQSVPSTSQFATPISRQSAPSTSQFATPISRQSAPSTSQFATPISRQSAPSTSQFATPISRQSAPSTSQFATPTSRQSAPSTSQFATPISRQSAPSIRQAAPLICTPSAHPDSNTVEILRTPATLAQRKFPGPAGLLPPLAAGQNVDAIYIPPPSTPAPSSTQRSRHLSVTPSGPLPGSSHGRGKCDTATGGGVFEQGPWIEMLQDLDLNDTYSSNLLSYSISNAIKQSSRKTLCHGKVAHLRVVLKNIVPAGRNASAVLQDPSGEIMCTIHSQVLEESQKELLPGAVLVLRQVSMFSPGPRKHYLNITPPNVVKVYPPENSMDHRQPLAQLLTHVERRFSEDSADINTTRMPKETTPTRPIVSGSIAPCNINQAAGRGSSHSQRLPARCGQRPLGANLVFGKGSSSSSSSSAPIDNLGLGRNGIGGGGGTIPALNSEHQVLPRSTSSEGCGDISASTATNGRFLFSSLCEDEFDDLFADIASDNF